METQDKSRFSIITSTGGGYHFLKEKIRYIMPLVIPLVIMHVVFYALIEYVMSENANMFQIFLLRLPVTIYEAWLVCILSRYMIMGEDFSKLPSDPAYIHQRRLNISAGVYIFILYTMLVFAFQHFVLDAVESRLEEISAIVEQARLEGKKPHEITMPQNDGGRNIVWMITVISVWSFMFWSLRLMLLPMFVALGGGVKQYIRTMEGAMTSLRVLFTWILSAMPIIALFMFVSQGLYSSEGEIGAVGSFMIYVIQALMWAMFLVVKIGAFNTALQEIYQNQ